MRGLAISAWIAILSAILLAQGAAGGMLTGVVTGPTSAPVPDAPIQAQNRQSGAVVRAVSQRPTVVTVLRRYRPAPMTFPSRCRAARSSHSRSPTSRSPRADATAQRSSGGRRVAQYRLATIPGHSPRCSAIARKCRRAPSLVLREADFWRLAGE